MICFGGTLGSIDALTEHGFLIGNATVQSSGNYIIYVFLFGSMEKVVFINLKSYFNLKLFKQVRNNLWKPFKVNSSKYEIKHKATRKLVEPTHVIIYVHFIT